MYNTLSQSPTFYRAGIYIRLSEADENKSYESESESVTNQRNILMKYVKDNEFIFIDEYVDDGYSGTNFDRPGFHKMIKDIEEKRINLVIVKDLSRLGRDHVETGLYVDKYFLEHQVRFISIQEGYDNAKNQASNDAATFIIAFNDYYSGNNSKKIRGVLGDKKKDGKFIGSKPSYGYIRDPEDKGHLLPDPEYAPVVRKIFEMAASGVRVTDIATYLNDNNIKTPSAAKRINSDSKAKYNPEWTISSVKKIIKNRMYTGDMVQSTQAKLSYKSKKRINLPEEMWDIVPNTHEALVDKATFERVQNSSKRTSKGKNDRDKRLFENLIFCKECGNTLTVSYRKNHKYWTVNCNKYSRDPKRRSCEPHFIPYEKLEKALLESIIKTCKKYVEKIDVKDLTEYISFKKNNNKNQENKIELLNKKIKECISKIDMLYEDKFKGNVSEETYRRLSKETESILEQSQIELKKIENSIKEEPIKNNLKEYESKIRKLINIEKPTRELLQAIISRIEIDKERNIEIFYKFNLLNNI